MGNTSTLDEMVPEEIGGFTAPLNEDVTTCT
jgi:hypothetical protein